MRRFSQLAVACCIAAVLAVSPAAAQSRPQCFDDTGAFNPPVPGACFVDLNGTFCAFGVDDDGDFWRFCPVGNSGDFLTLTGSGKVMNHAADNDVIEVDVCPAVLSGTACLSAPPVFAGGAGGDLVGTSGKISFNSIGSCTTSINGSGTATDADGNSFDVSVTVLAHPKAGGCVSVISDVTVTPVAP